MDKYEYFEKIKERRSHVTVQDLIKLLISFGFVLRRTSKNHFIARHENRIVTFAPPHPGKHVKKPYVNEIIKIIEEIKKEINYERKFSQYKKN